MKKIPLVSHYILAYPINLRYPRNWEFTKRIKYFSNGKMELEIKYSKRRYSFYFFYKDIIITDFIDYNQFVAIPVEPTETIIECTH